jgi:hypothetical protein
MRRVGDSRIFYVTMSSPISNHKGILSQSARVYSGSHEQLTCGPDHVSHLSEHRLHIYLGISVMDYGDSYYSSGALCLSRRPNIAVGVISLQTAS